MLLDETPLRIMRLRRCRILLICSVSGDGVGFQYLDRGIFGMAFLAGGISREDGTLRRAGGLFPLLLAVAVLLGGCETASDAIQAANPMNWFEGTDKTDSADKADEAKKQEEAKAQDAQAYPSLGTVPERPEDPQIKTDYEQMKEGLIADRENARYQDEQIRSGNGTAQTAGGGLRVATLPSAPPPPPTVSDSEATQQAGMAQGTSAPVTEPEGTGAASTQGMARPASPPPSAAALADSKPGTEPASPAKTGLKKPEAPASDALPGKVANLGDLVATIYFPQGGSGLSARDADVLFQVSRIFQQKNGKKITVVGHSSASSASSDAVQSGMVNYKVSLDRASSVAEKLLSFGIPADAIQIDARGASEPRYDEASKNGAAGNRRAEIFIAF